MTALDDDLRAIALAAVSEEGRTERWQADEETTRDMDELAAKRRQRNETDRYATKAEWEQAVLEDQDGPF